MIMIHIVTWNRRPCDSNFDSENKDLFYSIFTQNVKTSLITNFFAI